MWKLWKEKPPKICPRSYPIENTHFPTSFHSPHPPIPHSPNTLIIQQNSSQSIPNYRPHSPQSVEKSPRGKEKRGEKPKNSAINPGKTPQKGENKWKTSHTKRPLPAPHFSHPFSTHSPTFLPHFPTTSPQVFFRARKVRSFHVTRNGNYSGGFFIANCAGKKCTAPCLV